MLTHQTSLIIMYAEGIKRDRWSLENRQLAGRQLGLFKQKWVVFGP